MGVGRFKFVVWVPDPAELHQSFIRLKQMWDTYGWSYYHAAEEYTPTTNKLHLDGYYEMENPRKITTEIKKFTKVFGPGFGDLQIAKGTAGENRDYSQKEGRRFEESGDPSKGQGARVDVKAKCDEITSGKRTVEQILLEEPHVFHQYGRTLQKTEDVAARRKFRSWQTTCEWLWGPTGVGKSHRAFQDYDPDTHYLWKNHDKGWQDGYTGQPIVVINDFRGDIPLGQLLEMVDRFPYWVSRRGREPAPWLAKHIIITCPHPPEGMYNSGDDDNIDQLLRRITVTHMASRASGSEV